MDRQRIQKCSWRSTKKVRLQQEETRAKNSAGRDTGSARTGENDQVQSTYAAGPKSHDGLPAVCAPEQCASGAGPGGIRQSVRGQAVAAVAHSIEEHSAWGKGDHRRRRRWLAQFRHTFSTRLRELARHRPKGPAGVAAPLRYSDHAERFPLPSVQASPAYIRALQLNPVARQNSKCTSKGTQ
jgi:hypothetical protein